MLNYQRVHVPPYDDPPIVTITIDAIKTVVVKIYDRDRAELHGAKQLRQLSPIVDVRSSTGESFPDKS